MNKNIEQLIIKRLDLWIKHLESNKESSHYKAALDARNRILNPSKEDNAVIIKSTELTTLINTWYLDNNHIFSYKGVNLGCSINMRASQIFSNHISNKRD